MAVAAFTAAMALLLTMVDLVAQVVIQTPAMLPEHVGGQQPDGPAMVQVHHNADEVAALQPNL
jgi:hypothetical protein